MEVWVTMRVDFVSKTEKQKILKKEAHFGKGSTPHICLSLNQKSLRLEWDPLGGDWQDVLAESMGDLEYSGATGFFAVIWGDDGWYEILTQIDGRLRNYQYWEGEELDEFLTDVDNFMPFINKVRKKELANLKNHPAYKQNKVKPISLTASFDVERPHAEHWDISNQAWVESRLKLWKGLEKYLKETHSGTVWHKQFINFHKELFIYGTNAGRPFIIDGRLNSKLYKSKTHEVARGLQNQYATYSWLTFLVWYHPKPDTLNLRKLLEDFVSTEAEFSRLARKFIFSDIPVLSEKGTFWGNEEYLINVFFPTYKLNESLVVTSLDKPVEANIGLDSYKYDFVNICLKDSLKELNIGADFVPNAIGQYLWGHMSYALEHFPEYVFSDEQESIEIESEEPELTLNEWTQLLIKENTQENYEKFMASLDRQRQRSKDKQNNSQTSMLIENKTLLKKVISQIKSFDKRNDDSKLRPTTIAFVERVKAKVKKKEFSQALLAIWGEV